MSIAGDCLLVACGLVLGLLVAGRYWMRWRATSADLVAADARNGTLRRDRDAWRDEALRLRDVIDGKK